MADHGLTGFSARRGFKGDGAYSVARSGDYGFAGRIRFEHVARLNRRTCEPVGDVFDLDVERVANRHGVFVGKHNADDGAEGSTRFPLVSNLTASRPGVLMAAPAVPLMVGELSIA